MAGQKGVAADLADANPLRAPGRLADDDGAAVAQVVESALARAGLLDVSAPPLLIVAVSGGMDSMVLLHALLPLQDAGSMSLLVAHFDHGLRPTSAADAAFVQATAQEWGLPVVCGRWARAHTPSTGSLEADARAARYAFLASLGRSAQAEAPERQLAVLTAHHADDQSETLLLNLLRGSGLQGLTAMRSPAPLPGAPDLTLLRPLLTVPRALLAAYAAANGLRWREDESNNDTTRTRNLLRHAVLPLLESAYPGVAARLRRTAHLLADEAERLERLTAAQVATLIVEALPGTRVRLDADALAALPQADRRAVLRHALQQTFPEQPSITFEGYAALADALTARPTGAHGPHPVTDALAWTLLAATHDAAASVSLHRADALPLPPPGPWLDSAWRATVGHLPLPICGNLTLAGWRLTAASLAADAFPGRDAIADWEVWMDAACGPFTLSTPAPGVRMAPLGLSGHTRTLGNLFTDQKVAPALRLGWPLVVDGAGRVVWLCGLAVAQTAAVTDSTARVVHLRWTHEAA